MSALAGGIPRALPDHRSREARAYRACVEALYQRLPGLPASAVSTVREVGLVTIDLQRLRTDLEALRSRRGPGRRRGEERRLRSEIRKTRVQLMLLEKRAEEMAGVGNGKRAGGLGHAASPTPAELLAQLREEGALDGEG